MFIYVALISLLLIILGRVLLFKSRNLCEKYGYKVKDSIFANIADYAVLKCLREHRDNKEFDKYNKIVVPLFIFFEIVGWIVIILFIFN